MQQKLLNNTDKTDRWPLTPPSPHLLPEGWGSSLLLCPATATENDVLEGESLDCLGCWGKIWDHRCSDKAKFPLPR